MKNKLLFFVIYEHTFGASTHVFIGPRELYVKKAAKMFGMGKKEISPDPAMMAMFHSGDFVNGRTGAVEKTINILWLEEFKDTPKDYNSLGHEISHWADRTMHGRGIPPGVESTEVRAYLTGFFTGEFFRRLKEARKK